MISNFQGQNFVKKVKKICIVVKILFISCSKFCFSVLKISSSFKAIEILYFLVLEFRKKFLASNMSTIVAAATFQARAATKTGNNNSSSIHCNNCSTKTCSTLLTYNSSMQQFNNNCSNNEQQQHTTRSSYNNTRNITTTGSNNNLETTRHHLQNMTMTTISVPSNIKNIFEEDQDNDILSLMLDIDGQRLAPISIRTSNIHWVTLSHHPFDLGWTMLYKCL